jgi:hypothetical protein
MLALDPGNAQRYRGNEGFDIRLKVRGAYADMLVSNQTTQVDNSIRFAK